MPRWARIVGKGIGLVVELSRAWLEARKAPTPLRVDELHVGATTTDAVEREREAAAAKWPDADTTKLPRPPRVPRGDL